MSPICEPCVTDELGTAHVEFRAQDPDSEHVTLLLRMADTLGLRPVPQPLDGFTADNDGVVLVAYVNGQPTGCGGFRVFPDDLSGDTVEFALLYVRPGSRRAGLARSILEQLERVAVHDGFQRVVLRLADEQLLAARVLVEILGYRHDARLDDGRTGHTFGKALPGAEDSESGRESGGEESWA
jgi:GNAT superfamily N-acetyltransferase